MSEQATRQDSRQEAPRRSSQDAQPGQQGSSSLVTDRGSTSISKGAVSQIIDSVSGRAEGIRASSSGAGRGTNIDVGSEEVAVDLKVSADYNRSILQVTEALRDEITDRVQTLLGLRVSECNITVNEIYFPHEERQQQREEEEEEESRVR